MHFSAAFQQVAGFALEVRLQEHQHTLGILVQKNAHQLDYIGIFQGYLKGFLYVSSRLHRQFGQPHPGEGASSGRVVLWICAAWRMRSRKAGFAIR